MQAIVLVTLSLMALAIAAPPPPVQLVPANKVPQIIRSEYEKSPEGAYSFSYETDQGISRSEAGEIKETVDAENKPHSVVVVRGQYAYTDNDGVPEQVEYYADETGYHASGKSIPV